MARATLDSPARTYRFTVKLKIGEEITTYPTHDATVTWDSSKSKTRLRFSAAVMENGPSECSKLFTEIDCSNQCSELTIEAMKRDGEAITGPATIAVTLPSSPIVSFSRIYQASESSHLMDTLTIELYGTESPFHP